MSSDTHVDDVEGDSESRSFLDAWANSVYSSLHSGDEALVRIIKDGALPFKCVKHGWFGIFPWYMYGAANCMLRMPVLDVVFHRRLPIDWPHLSFLRHFLFHLPLHEGEHQDRSSFKIDVSLKGEYMYIDQMAHDPAVGVALEELQFAAGVIFMITPSVDTLIASKLLFDKRSPTGLLPHLSTDYTDVDFARLYARYRCLKQCSALNLAERANADCLFFVWRKKQGVVHK